MCVITSEESFADGTPLPPPEEPPGGPGKGPSQAQLLMAMAEDTYRLIRSADGRAYAVPKMGPQIAVPLASRSGNSIRARLAASLHRQTGKVASASALADCITVLDGRGQRAGPAAGVAAGRRARRHGRGRHGHRDRPVHHHHPPRLGDRDRLAGDLPPLRADPPARPARSAAAPWTRLRELINLPEEDYRLAIGWVVAAYLTGIPHPILLVQGEQGTAKSNLIRTLLALVDPQPAADRTPPKDNREWAIFARASWAFSYDNITDIPPWLSNALCKGVTGDAVLQRVLHSDDDIGVYSFQRVIALTTIAIRHDVAGDLADRILLVEPEVIDKRRTETEFTAARAAALPGALGAILDLVAGVLARAARHHRGQRAADGRLRQSPRRPRHRHRVGHPGQLPGQGRHPGAVPDRGQHLRLRHLPARHPAQPRRPGPGPVGRHRRRTARHAPADLRRSPHARQRPARGRPRGRPPGPRDRPVPAQSRHRHPGQPHRQAPAPCASAKSNRPQPENPLALLLKKKKRHVTNVTTAASPQVSGPPGGDIADVTCRHSCPTSPGRLMSLS